MDKEEILSKGAIFVCASTESNFSFSIFYIYQKKSF